MTNSNSFCREHRNIIAQQNSRQTTMTIDRIHNSSFALWFAEKVSFSIYIFYINLMSHTHVE